MIGNRPAKPFDAVFAVTYRCNARCQMCNIWKVKNHSDLRPEEYGNIPNTLRHINVSGGEPFLRSDLPYIIRVVSRRNPKAHILISTNGFQPSRICAMVSQALAYHRRLGVGVSIDGIGAKHDEVRGIPGGYDKAVETLVRLRDEVGLRDIRVAFTLQDSNVGHLLKVYELSQRLRVQFTWVVAQVSSHYFQNSDNSTGHWSGQMPLDAAVLELIRRQLLAPKPKEWARAFFSHGNHRCARKRPRPIRCQAGSSFFFVAPNGDVHACNARNLLMGNIRRQLWSEIWCGQKAETVRRNVSQCGDNCWMVCTARSSMIQSAPIVAAWIAFNKLRAHLGLRGPTSGLETAVSQSVDGSRAQASEDSSLSAEMRVPVDSAV